MRRSVLYFAVCLTCCIPYSKPAAAPLPETGAIGGMVLNLATAAPLPRAQVHVQIRRADRSFAVCPTDREGRFLCEGLPEGAYLIRATRDGFPQMEYGARRPGQPGRLLRLSRGERKLDLMLGLMPTGSIQGTVFAQNGQPASGAMVQILTADYSRGFRRLAGGQMATTGSRGEYVLQHLWPDEYYVVASARWHGASVFGSEASMAAQAEPPATLLGREIYRGATSVHRATPVRVDPASHIREIDFHLALSPGSSLRITVHGVPENATPEATRLELHPAGLPLIGSSFVSGPVRLDERPLLYLAESLAPGDYWIAARTEVDKQAYFAQDRIEVSGSGETEHSLTLHPGTVIEGEVIVEGGSSRPGPFTVSLIRGDTLRSDSPLLWEATGPDLRFRFDSVPPGLWDIEVSPIPEGGYVKAMYLGEQDVLTRDMVIGPGSKGPLRIILSTRAAAVSGRVRADAGDPSPVVLLAPVGPFRDVMSFHAMGRADETGIFSIRGLRPGEYEAFAFPELDYGAWLRPEFRSAYSGRGKRVTLAEGQTVELELERSSDIALGSGP